MRRWPKENLPNNFRPVSPGMVNKRRRTSGSFDAGEPEHQPFRHTSPSSSSPQSAVASLRDEVDGQSLVNLCESAQPLTDSFMCSKEAFESTMATHPQRHTLLHRKMKIEVQVAVGDLCKGDWLEIDRPSSSKPNMVLCWATVQGVSK